MQTVRIPAVFARFGFWHSDPWKVERGNGLKAPFDVSPYRMVRRDGDEYLMIVAGRDGLPWGRLAKMLVALLATEAVARGGREIVLSSAQDTIRRLAIDGKGGHYTRSVEQAIRALLGCRFYRIVRGFGDTLDVATAWAEAIDQGRLLPEHHALSSWTIAEGVRLWDKDGDPVRLWADRQPLTIRLSEEFCAEARNGVDLDHATWLGLSRSPVALDVYAWANLRCRTAFGTARIPSGSIARQLGFTCRPAEAKAKMEEAVNGNRATNRRGIRDFWDLRIEFGAGRKTLTMLGTCRGKRIWEAMRDGDVRDGFIRLDTCVPHVSQIALDAQEIGPEAAEYSAGVLAELERRAKIARDGTKADRLVESLSAASPKAWRAALENGGWT